MIFLAKKNSKKLIEKIGVWAYVVGFIIALLVAIASPTTLTAGSAALLAILGIIVGLINITDQEVSTYLMAAVAFIISAWALGDTIGAWPFIKTFMTAIIVFTAPGALVVSFKALYNVAKD